MYARISCFKRFYLKIKFLTTVDNVLFFLGLLATDTFTLPYYKVCKLECVEIAIWPLLYLKEEWCENNVKGHVSLFIYVLIYCF